MKIITTQPEKITHNPEKIKDIYASFDTEGQVWTVEFYDQYKDDDFYYSYSTGDIMEAFKTVFSEQWKDMKSKYCPPGMYTQKQAHARQWELLYMCIDCSLNPQDILQLFTFLHGYIYTNELANAA